MAELQAKVEEVEKAGVAGKDEVSSHFISYFRKWLILLGLLFNFIQKSDSDSVSSDSTEQKL